MSANLCAQHYRTIFSLYYTPAKLYKWKCRDTSVCPRCNNLEADLLHMFATCPALESYWRLVLSYIGDIIESPLIFSPTLIIFGYDVKYGKNLLLFIAIVTARMCIAKHWIDSNHPSYAQWLNYFLAIYHLEIAVNEGKDIRSYRNRTKVWAPLKSWILQQEHNYG